jgi:hypothetical protein
MTSPRGKRTQYVLKSVLAPAMHWASFRPSAK